ncbi:MAG: NAD(P)(+) transhydrogenase (Re/Si-specific) subunit beta [Phycisphaeraceae bacterium]|nr:NAD(P)(+) transhydrogenase (Re/Si-specific) subunit beta [Phycisphaeraceae bacterium]
MPVIATNLTYLLAAAFFILGIKLLASPRTAVRGNALAAVGMLLAVVVTLLDRKVLGFGAIAGGMAIGGAAGAWAALRVKMTAMPQMVALLNGLGGGASVCVAGAAMVNAHSDSALEVVQVIAGAASGLIGGVTFWGSLLAYGKLDEWRWASRLPSGAWWRAVNGLLLLACMVFAVLLVKNPEEAWTYWALVGTASVLGMTMVAPIGGADMPVVIALLNSYSGVAGAFTGFILGNNALIISGALVGASGLILCQIMCRAMNRSLASVMLGAGAATGGGSSADEVYGGRVKSTSPEEVAMLLESAGKVVIVPGYGLAVAQAQHVVQEISSLLTSKGAKVIFAIHPVAGRMPGHMNVLLAEAKVPYEQMQEMDEVNAGIEQADVVLVVGANDVVNPDARTNPRSVIAGMPIINADLARSVVVVKRSLSPGFAGIPNPLFASDNCTMLFADADKGLREVVVSLKGG